jgi:major membrane immunogen (membrane-anchored lipoprotein)
MAVLLAGAALLLLALTACGKPPVYSDGTYTGVSSEDEKGAYGEVTIRIEDGAVAACEYVTWQKDGSIKDEEYGKSSGSQEYYDKAQLAVRAMQQYADALVEQQSLKKIDAVSGATNSYDQFREAVTDALDEAKE